MKILFGAELDGSPCPEDWRGVGKLVCGPQGLLNTLEVATGLPPINSVSELERVISYREAVRGFLQKNPATFFARSFAVESLSSSRVLLHWRDELRLAGWSLTQEGSGDIPSRLKDLAGVETNAPGEASFKVGMAERIDRIQDRLKQGATTGIDQLVVIDLPESLPSKWAQLLTLLGAVFESKTPSSPTARKGTRLHALQSRLLGANAGKENDDSADQSVVIWRDFSEITLARAAAQYWQNPSIGPQSVLVAPEESRGRLNDSLRQLDLPTVTAQASSLSGTLPQLLPLTLRLHWAPFDPQAWLEFLLHPVCPVMGSLRYRLARAINETPGRGNQAWKKAIGRALEDAGDDSVKRAKIERAVSSWIELPAYGREEGIPGEMVASTAAQLAAWLRAVGAAKQVSHETEATLWLSAAGKIDAFGRALSVLPQISHQELERLLASWLPSAGEGVQEVGELGGPLPVARPGHVLAPVEHLSWWQPSERGSYRRPWTRKEREWLSAQGATLVTSQAMLEAEEATTFRAILNATQSLTLFIPSGDAEGQASPIVTRILAELGSGVIKEAAGQIETASLPVRTLPAPRRWWQLSDPTLLVPRERESYSSISTMIYSPYQWVLNYQARLESGQLFGFGVGDNFIRRGTLLHDLAERLFVPDLEAGDSPLDWVGCNEGALQSWMDAVWPKLLDERAAHYRLPGLESARNGLLHTGRQALWKLVQHFQEAGVTVVEVEKYISDVAFVGGQLNGRIDLIARTPDAVAVVDLKLGGKAIRSAEVAGNRHLQLAVYGHLLRETEQIDPSVAFFILGRGGVLLTRSPGFFPGAASVSPENPEDTTEWCGCWSEFEKIWQWRRSQLDLGRIEVTVGGTEADQMPPLEHWAAPHDADYYNDFDALTGWSQTS